MNNDNTHSESLDVKLSYLKASSLWQQRQRSARATGGVTASTLSPGGRSPVVFSGITSTSFVPATKLTFVGPGKSWIVSPEQKLG